MAVIDIGGAATDRGGNLAATYTWVDATNPANDTGTLDTFEIFATVSQNLSNAVVGTFSGSGTSYDDRDYESIGSVYGGSKQTFTGKNCDVVTGDFIGIYYSSGKLERDNSGGSGIYYVSGNKFGSGSATYTAAANYIMSLYATGATAGGGPTPVIKVGGVWKETTSQKIKVGGAWKAISNIKVKVSGVWKSAT